MLPSVGYFCHFPCPFDSPGGRCQRLCCQFRHREMRWELSEAARGSSLEVLGVQRSHVESIGEKRLVGRMSGGLGEGLATNRSHLFTPPTLGRDHEFSCLERGVRVAFVYSTNVLYLEKITQYGFTMPKRAKRDVNYIYFLNWYLILSWHYLQIPL